MCRSSNPKPGLIILPLLALAALTMSFLLALVTALRLWSLVFGQTTPPPSVARQTEPDRCAGTVPYLLRTAPLLESIADIINEAERTLDTEHVTELDQHAEMLRDLQRQWSALHPPQALAGWHDVMSQILTLTASAMDHIARGDFSSAARDLEQVYYLESLGETLYDEAERECNP